MALRQQDQDKAPSLPTAIDPAPSHHQYRDRGHQLNMYDGIHIWYSFPSIPLFRLESTAFQSLPSSIHSPSSASQQQQAFQHLGCEDRSWTRRLWFQYQYVICRQSIDATHCSSWPSGRSWLHRGWWDLHIKSHQHCFLFIQTSSHSSIIIPLSKFQHYNNPLTSNREYREQGEYTSSVERSHWARC